jgi:hypothetical protein
MWFERTAWSRGSPYWWMLERGAIEVFKGQYLRECDGRVEVATCSSLWISDLVRGRAWGKLTVLGEGKPADHPAPCSEEAGPCPRAVYSETCPAEPGIASDPELPVHFAARPF